MKKHYVNVSYFENDHCVLDRPELCYDALGDDGERSVIRSYIKYNEVGSGYEFDEVVRQCEAGIYLDGESVGTINFMLLCRDRMMRHGLGIHEVCDAISSELDAIASKFFDLDGG